MGKFYPESKVEIQGLSAKFYDNLMNFASMGAYSRFIRKAISLMDIHPDDAILDFGAGTGRNALLMQKYLTGRGEVLGLEMDTIVCPPELEGVMFEAVYSSSGVTANSNTANPISSWIKNVIVLPNATDANDWYGLCTSYPLKPFFYQDREAPVPVLDDTQVKANRKLIYSVELRGNAGYGFPAMAVKVVNS